MGQLGSRKKKRRPENRHGVQDRKILLLAIGVHAASFINEPIGIHAASLVAALGPIRVHAAPLVGVGTLRTAIRIHLASLPWSDEAGVLDPRRQPTPERRQLGTSNLALGGRSRGRPERPGGRRATGGRQDGES